MSEEKTLQKKLVKTIKNYHRKGWSPATSTNYSYRENENSTEIFVSRSGVDKSQFHESDFMPVDFNAKALSGFENNKPSAETLIHCVLYELFPAATVILHSHSTYSVLNSQKYGHEILFEGYEIQKGFKGQTTHENSISIPILDNSQDMNEFVKRMKEAKEAFSNHCFIIRNHGTYAWGDTLSEAKRHLESLEYLLEVNWKLNH